MCMLDSCFNRASFNAGAPIWRAASRPNAGVKAPGIVPARLASSLTQFRRDQAVHSTSQNFLNWARSRLGFCLQGRLHWHRNRNHSVCRQPARPAPPLPWAAHK